MKRALFALLLLPATAAPAVVPPFTIERIAAVDGARELAAAPDGTLFAGTSGGDVYVVPDAEGRAGSARIFASPGDAPAAGVAFANGTLYIGTNHAVWRVPVRSGDLRARTAPTAIAHVRTGESDGHSTTSVAVSGSHVYASVGSSCNACTESDPTRATVGEVRGGRYEPIAKRIRNAIALAIDNGGHLWAGVAGQDELAFGHPYEIFDDITSHAAPADYGWPVCYENRTPKPGTHENCSGVAVPQVVFPAYETPIGAAFYPQNLRGRYVFPPRYRGGAFVALHGSWHSGPQGLIPPRVVFVPMRDNRPARGVDWSNPTTQWTQFVGGYQEGGETRTGRPTGVAVGPQGSLFVADDQQGAVYRIRPR